MNRSKTSLEFLAVLLVVLLLACDLSAQCGPNGCPTASRTLPLYQSPYLNLNQLSPCGPTGCPTGAQPASRFTWVRLPDCAQFALFKDGVQQGNYDFESKIYRPFRAPDQWGDIAEPPTTPPATPTTGQKTETKPVTVSEIPGCTLDDDGKPNFGVLTDPREGRDAEPRYQVNGKEATRSDVLQAFENQATDQSSKLRLTVIGPRHARQIVLEDLKRTPDLQHMVKDFLLKDYDPNDWEVARSGFFTKGAPTIYVQAPSGKVLHRQDSYQGADDLASVLRKANALYKAEADPNLSKAVVLGLFGIPLEVWIVIGIVLFFVIPRKDGNQ